MNRKAEVREFAAEHKVTTGGTLRRKTPKHLPGVSARQFKKLRRAEGNAVCYQHLVELGEARQKIKRVRHIPKRIEKQIAKLKMKQNGVTA
jgi:hypothetical protein